MGTQKREEVIPLPGEDKKGLHIGSVVKPGLEGWNEMAEESACLGLQCTSSHNFPPSSDYCLWIKNDVKFHTVSSKELNLISANPFKVLEIPWEEKL